MRSNAKRNFIISISVIMVLTIICVAGCSIKRPAEEESSGDASQEKRVPSASIAESLEADFDNEKLDPTKWQVETTGDSTITIANGICILKGSSADHRATLTSKPGFNIGIALEYRAQLSSDGMNEEAYILNVAGFRQDISCPTITGEKSPLNKVDICWSNGGNHYKSDVGEAIIGDEQYHTFKIEWRPSAINWYIDGKLVHKVTDTAQICNISGQKVLLQAYGDHVLKLDWVRVKKI